MAAGYDTEATQVKQLDEDKRALLSPGLQFSVKISV